MISAASSCECDEVEKKLDSVMGVLDEMVKSEIQIYRRSVTSDQMRQAKMTGYSPKTNAEALTLAKTYVNDLLHLSDIDVSWAEKRSPYGSDYILFDVGTALNVKRVINGQRPSDDIYVSSVY